MGKYDKNFVTEPKPGDNFHIDTDMVKFPIYVDSEVVEGSYYFMAPAFREPLTGERLPSNTRTAMMNILFSLARTTKIPGI